MFDEVDALPCACPKLKKQISFDVVVCGENGYWVRKL
jgi:hypothetical protein